MLNKDIKQALSNKRILVTGGDGFLGRHLSAELNGFCKELYLYRNDIRQIGAFEEKYDIVIHLAGITKIDSNNTADLLFDVNVNGTLAVMEYCRKTGARCIFASSSAVYKPTAEKILLKEDALLAPETLYGISKKSAENICKFYAENFNLSVIILRIFNMYGPRQQEPFVIPYMAARIKKAQVVTLKTPKAYRDYIFVKDAAEAFIRSCAIQRSSNGQCVVFNVGTGIPTEIKELMLKIAERYKVSPKIESGKDIVKDYVIADISNAAESINWHPLVSVDEGIVSL